MVTTVIRGGLCNNLFQMAMVLGHSIKYNVPYCIPLTVENPHYSGQKPYIFNGINYCKEELDLPLYKEHGFQYNDILFIDNVCFDGYWQSHRYFDFCMDEVLKAFDFKWQLEKGVCAVHVRRGDYLLYPDTHPFVGEEYLTKAIHYFQERDIYSFKFYSNDIPWCREFVKSQGYDKKNFAFIEGNNEMEDLRQGSCAEHQIISNGTFGLWMYYLNRNQDKTCIAPKRWFGKLGPQNTDDLYPINSIKL